MRYFLVSFNYKDSLRPSVIALGSLTLTTEGDKFFSFSDFVAAVRKPDIMNSSIESTAIISVYEFKSESDYNHYCGGKENTSEYEDYKNKIIKLVKEKFTMTYDTFVQLAGLKNLTTRKMYDEGYTIKRIIKEVFNLDIEYDEE